MKDGPKWEATMIAAGGAIARSVAYSNKRQARLNLFHEFPWAYDLFKQGHKIKYRELKENPSIMQAPELPETKHFAGKPKPQAPGPLRQINARHRNVKKAAKLYAEFRESVPKRGGVLEIDWPKTLMAVGNLRFVGYDTTLRGKTTLFKHEFAPGSRPILCADPENGQLYIVGGRYRFKTGVLNGIVDIDARGKDIDDGA